MGMKVLVAEDDTNIRKGLVEILSEEGYRVIEAASGDRAIALFKSEAPDFVCLDIMMPGKSGYDVCRELRAMNDEVPIIFISAKSEEIDRVVGLEVGADDYILKPFGVKEVTARIRAITRRCYRSKKSVQPNEAFVIADLRVMPAELGAQRGSTTIELSVREIAILRLLAEQAGKVVDRDTLLNVCWGATYFPNSRTLDQTISSLRRKVEIDPKNPSIIETVHGVGYRHRAGR